MVWQSWTDTFSLPWPQVLEIQLLGLQHRFREMVERIPVLATLAEEQGVREITRLEDGAPLLFPHPFYKSYPLSFIEKSRFDRLTQWLDNLTSHDLSSLDTSGVESIDDWIDLLDRETPMRVLHTSGTTGKLSFLPRSTSERPYLVRGWRLGFEGFGDEPNAKPVEGFGDVPVIAPAYRRGAIGMCRTLDAFVDYFFDGDENMVHALNPGRLSADILSLGGRLSAAESKGELGHEKISPSLMARRQQFMEEQKNAPERRRAFFEMIAEKFRGRRIAALGSWLQLQEMAENGRANGLDRLFGSDSLIWTAGGTKGRVLPADFKQTTAAFFGVPKVHEGYGMSEISVMMPMCPQGQYHVPPWIIPYVLEPKSGTPYPRSGTQTGRLGMIDLLALTFWGGILSGDEVTIVWGDENPCPCGRIGPYLHDTVRRYSEKEGGDDKITCAGAPEAIDKALSFIASLE